MITLDQFIEIERELDLNEVQVNGCHFWNYWRVPVYWALLRGDANTQFSPEPGNRLKDVSLSLLQITRLRKAEVCLVCHPRRIQQNGLYRCLYTGELTKSLDSCLTLEMPYPPGHLRPVEGEKPVYTDACIFPGSLKSRFVEKFCPRKHRDIKAEIEEKLAPAFSKLEEAHGEPLNRPWCVKSMARFVLAYHIRRRLLRGLVRKISPKVIVEVVSYSPDNMLLNEVAREFRIPTLELQHGIMGSDHAAYHFAPGIQVSQFPDYVLTFSDFWSRTARFPIAPERVIAVGYPYLEERMAQCRAATERSAAHTAVFLSSPQGGQELSAIASDLARRVPAKDLRILFKLHPAEYTGWSERYLLLADARIEVIGRRDVDVYDCFAQADIQVGVASTAIYEGIAFGLDTYVLQTSEFEKNTGEIKTLCADGYATVFSTAEELVVYLQSGPQTANKDTSAFWKPDAVENIRAVIREVAAGSVSGLEAPETPGRTTP